MELLSGCLNGLVLFYKVSVLELGQFWGYLDLSGLGIFFMFYIVWVVILYGVWFFCFFYIKLDGVFMFICVNLLFVQFLFIYFFLLCCCLFFFLKVYLVVNSFRLLVLFVSLMIGKIYIIVSIYILWYCVLISMYKIKIYFLVCILVLIQ